MKYELKNIKSLNTSSGVAWTASIYREDKRVGTAEDQGRGGSVDVFGLSVEQQNELLGWTYFMAKGSGLWMDNDMYRTINYVTPINADTPTAEIMEIGWDVELAIAYLLEVVELNKIAKKNLLFRVPNNSDPVEGDFDWDTYKSRIDLRTHKSEDVFNELVEISQKYGSKTQLWDFRVKKWIGIEEVIDSFAQLGLKRVGA